MGRVRLSNLTIDLIDAALTERTAAQAGAAFFKAVQRYGSGAIFARTLGRDGPRTMSRISPPGWEALYADKRFENVNYLNREVKRRSRPFAWSEIKLLTRGERELAAALADFDFADGLAIPFHGPGGSIGVTSLAFNRLDALAPDERQAIELAATVLHGRMQALAPEPAPAAVKLSARERDCLALVAQGRTDADIAELFGVSETTVITHVQNARRKLNAKTRAHAVALALAIGAI